MIEPRFILRVSNLLGEGVVWDARIQSALWIDIEGARFWQWEWGAAEARSFPLPQRPGSFALTAIEGTYLGAFEHGFARFTPRDGTFDMRAPVTINDPDLRMNDGRVDRNGTFWAGSMAERRPPSGSTLTALWRYNGSGEAIRSNIEGIRIPNSLCWNVNGDLMYFTDSPRCTIWRYVFDRQHGPIGIPEVFAATAPGVHPDGSCVDANDYLWNAQWGGGEVVRYAPDGRIERRLALPVSQPSCVALGGPNLDHLFVTSARVDLTPEALALQPLAGALLVYDVAVRGLPEIICQTPN